MNCPKCKSDQFVKDGIVKGRQRFQCKVCRYRYTVEFRGKSTEIKRMALHLYLEGLGFRSISRILKVSNVAVLNWIKAFGSEIEKIQGESTPIKVKATMTHNEFFNSLLKRYSLTTGILPQNCRYMKTLLNGYKVLIIEEEPKIRSISFNQDLSSLLEIHKLTGKLDEYEIKKKGPPYRFTLSFPYIIYMRQELFHARKP